MSDYIKREDAIRATANALRLQKEADFDFDAENLMNAIPSADVVERKKGEWIVSAENDYYDVDGYHLITITCSNCGKKIDAENGKGSNFCSECGAIMTERSEG